MADSGEYKEDPFDEPYFEDNFRFWLEEPSPDTNMIFDLQCVPQDESNDHQFLQCVPQDESNDHQFLQCVPQDVSNDPQFILQSDDDDGIAFEDPVLQGVDYLVDHIDNVENGNDWGTQEEENAEFMHSDHSNVMPLTVWPPPPVSFSCTCCHVLRDIVHSNGRHTTKLEVHGRIGLISHAILSIRSEINRAVPTKHEMIDFSMHSMEGVKQYLMQYCQQRRQAGFVMLRDPLHTFYRALCAGLNLDYMNGSEPLQPFQSKPGPSNRNHPRDESSTTKLPKSNLAAQRERTGLMTLSDVQDYFHLPIETAAKRLKICPTVLKKICRKYGLHRWPHRKIKSVNRQISALESSLAEKDAEERAIARAEIERLKEKREEIRNGT